MPDRQQPNEGATGGILGLTLSGQPPLKPVPESPSTPAIGNALPLTGRKFFKSHHDRIWRWRLTCEFSQDH